MIATATDNSWKDTLELFLSNSNENEKVLDVFEKRVLPFILNKDKKKIFRWLEVGPGNGEKTFAMVNILINHRFKSAIELTLVEPSFHWIEFLKINGVVDQLKEKGLKISLLNESFETIGKSGELSSYDFVSLIQVMYEETIKDALLSAIDEATSTLFWIDTEDVSSDLYKIRRLLNVSLKNEVFPFLDQMIDDLKCHDVNYRIIKTKGKVCTLDIQELYSNDRYWIFPFTAGLSYDDYDELPDDLRLSIVTTIRNYVCNLNTPVLNIEDKSMLIYY